MIANRTGRWFFGVTAVKTASILETEIKSGHSCEVNNLSEDLVTYDFPVQTYSFQVYSGGCYYFNTSTEVWEAVGVKVH